MVRKINEDKLIVITGAAGFIGSGVVRYLNDLGYTNLLLCDNIGESDKWKNLVGKQFVDWISIEDLFVFLQGQERDIDAIIHLGACSDTMETDGDYLMENNYRYSVELASYALEHHIRFIYASSAATYGDGSKGFSDDVGFMRGFAPLNLYGYSKHLFDLWAYQNNVLNQMVGLKYFNVFGPNENHKGRMASMVYKMVPLAQKEGVIRLFKSNDKERYGDGEQVRDFIYVKDAVKMTCAFLENEVNGLFNIGTGKTTTWNELAKAIFEALDLPCKIEYVAMPEELSKAYQNYTCADMKKYMQALGLDRAPIEYTIKSAVADYVQNYLLKGERW